MLSEDYPHASGGMRCSPVSESDGVRLSHSGTSEGNKSESGDKQLVHDYKNKGVTQSLNGLKKKASKGVKFD